MTATSQSHLGLNRYAAATMSNMSRGTDLVSAEAPDHAHSQTAQRALLYSLIARKVRVVHHSPFVRSPPAVAFSEDSTS